MELALYVSNVDDLRSIEQGLRRIDFWNAPKFIFEIMFGNDSSTAEYFGNLAAAEWLENYLASDHDSFSRLYFGQEFCENLIPSSDVLQEVVAFAHDLQLSFTYVTGYVTDAGLAATRRNLASLAKQAPGSEVVFNDWGVLTVLAEEFPSLVPVLGRLLIKQQRMARFTTTPPPVNLRGINATETVVRAGQQEALRALNLSIPEYRERLEGLGVRRFDLDIVPQGVELPADVWGLEASCYYPWGYVTGSRNCLTAGVLEAERSFVVTDSRCAAPCRRFNRATKVLQFPQATVQRGNSVFIYHTDYAAPYLQGQIPVDRIVFEPWIPL
jgi:hypothetical protein